MVGRRLVNPDSIDARDPQSWLSGPVDHIHAPGALFSGDSAFATDLRAVCDVCSIYPIVVEPIP